MNLFEFGDWLELTFDLLPGDLEADFFDNLVIDL